MLSNDAEPLLPRSPGADETELTGKTRIVAHDFMIRTAVVTDIPLRFDPFHRRFLSSSRPASRVSSRLALSCSHGSADNNVDSNMSCMWRCWPQSCKRATRRRWRPAGTYYDVGVSAVTLIAPVPLGSMDR
jgi:hypothetical protein